MEGIIRKQSELNAEVVRLGQSQESIIQDYKSLQDEVRGVVPSVRRIVVWGVGLSVGAVVVVVAGFFAYLVADLNRHEAEPAHPMALAEMAAVKAKITSQEKTTDRIARLVEKNYDLLIEMKAEDGRDN